VSFCELGGRQSADRKKVIVDGTIFNVCIACSKHGKPYVPAQVPARKKPALARQKDRITMADRTMIAPDFAGLIREARMKMGLTHEQLGMKMNEKAQLLKKFESGALKPDELLAKKLERFLGITLYVSAADSGDEA
jgi:putative transcription factor